MLALWFSLRERLGRMVFSNLIAPALAVRRLRPAMRLSAAYALGALVYALGLALSARFDLPSGAMVVPTMAALAPLVPLLLAPRKV